MSEFDDKNPFESEGGWDKNEAQISETDGEQKNPFESNAGEQKNPFEDFSGNAGEQHSDTYDYIEQPKKKHSGMAIAAMVLGIVSVSLQIVCCCCSYLSSILALVLGVVALVLGVVSNKRVKDPFALTGIILGSIGTALGLALTIFWFASMGLSKQWLEDLMKQYPDMFPQSPDSSSGRNDILVRLMNGVRLLIKK